MSWQEKCGLLVCAVLMGQWNSLPLHVSKQGWLAQLRANQQRLALKSCNFEAQCTRVLQICPPSPLRRWCRPSLRAGRWLRWQWLPWRCWPDVCLAAFRGGRRGMVLPGGSAVLWA